MLYPTDIIILDLTIGVVVNIKKLGKIEGSVEKSFNGRSYYSFEGIPYAVPPLGVNRFAVSSKTFQYR